MISQIADKIYLLFNRLLGITKHNSRIRYCPFVRGIHRWPVDYHKRSVTLKASSCHDVTMHLIGKSRTRLTGRIELAILAVGMRVRQYDYCHNTGAFWLQDDIPGYFDELRYRELITCVKWSRWPTCFVFVDIVISVGKTTFYRFCVSSFWSYHSSTWNCIEIPNVVRHFEWRHLVTVK